MKAGLFRRLMNLYPPYLGAGIRIVHISPDFRHIDVRMKLKWYNRNYVGTHFGGSLYAMTDPFYMLMLIRNLGNRYVVWDQAAAIQFRRPGRGIVYARFELTESMIADVVSKTDGGDTCRPVWSIDVVDENEEVVATVKKTLYIRKKTDNRTRETHE